MKYNKYLRVYHQQIETEEGSLALEHILFIGAVVALSAGLFVFYGKLSNYFESIDLSNLPTTITTSDSGSGSSN